MLSVPDRFEWLARGPAGPAGPEGPGVVPVANTPGPSDVEWCSGVPRGRLVRRELALFPLPILQGRAIRAPTQHPAPPAAPPLLRACSRQVAGLPGTSALGDPAKPRLQSGRPLDGWGRYAIESAVEPIDGFAFDTERAEHREPGCRCGRSDAGHRVPARDERGDEGSCGATADATTAADGCSGGCPAARSTADAGSSCCAAGDTGSGRVGTDRPKWRRRWPGPGGAPGECGCSGGTTAHAVGSAAHTTSGGTVSTRRPGRPGCGTGGGCQCGWCRGCAGAGAGVGRTCRTGGDRRGCDRGRVASPIRR